MDYVHAILSHRHTGNIPEYPGDAGFGLFADSLMRYHDDVLINYGVQVIAIRGLESRQPVFIPKGDDVIRRHDVLTLLGPVKVLEKLPK
jgi:hypothetical protein